MLFLDPKVLFIVGGGIVFGLALELAYRYLLIKLVRRQVVEPAVRQSLWVVKNPGPPFGRKLLTDVVEGEVRALPPSSHAPGDPRG